MDGGGQFSQGMHSDQAGEEKTPITRKQKAQETVKDEKNLPFLRALIIAAPFSKWDVSVLRKTDANRDRVLMMSPRLLVAKDGQGSVQMCK